MKATVRVIAEVEVEVGGASSNSIPSITNTAKGKTFEAVRAALSKDGFRLLTRHDLDRGTQPILTVAMIGLQLDSKDCE